MKTKKYWRKIILGLVVILTICALSVIWLDQKTKVFLNKSDISYPSPTPCPTFECTPDPNSRRIAFSSDRFNQGQEVYVMNADGTCVTQLTDFSDKEAARPAWSPDSTKILFELYSKTDSLSINLYSITIDGNQVTQLTRDGRNCDARWSPDGSKIAFKSNRDGRTSLFVMNADGSQERRLTDVSTLGCRRKEYTQEWSYDWSPDGKRIAFTGKDQQDIYITNVESGQVTNVTNNHPVKNRVIVWWPGKDKILFESDRLAVENEARDLLTLYIMDGDGANIQRVIDFAPIPVPPGGTKPNKYYLRGWVPTTTLQLVLSNVYEQHMYVLDVACALENPPEPGMMPEGCYRKFYKPLFEFDEGATLISADEIYWSSGDPKLALRLTDFLGNMQRDEIIVVNYDGTGAINLTGCSAHDVDPAWSP